MLYWWMYWTSAPEDARESCLLEVLTPLQNLPRRKCEEASGCYAAGHLAMWKPGAGGACK